MTMLLAEIEELLRQSFLVFLRFSSMVLVLPGLSERYVSVRHRLAIAVVLTLFLAPLVGDMTGYSLPDDIVWSAAIWPEILIGSLLGIAIRAMVFCLQLLGAIVAQSISLTQILGANVATDAQSTVSNILVISGLTIIMISGFMEAILMTAVQSYVSFPLGFEPNLSRLLEMLVHTLRLVTELALQLAAPFLFIALYYNAALAVINRAMPQLLVSFIGAPAIIAVSLALLMISAKPMMSTWNLELFRLMDMLVR